MTIRSCQDQQTHTNNHTHTHTVHAQAAIKCTELIQQRHRTDMHRYFHSAWCEKCHSFRSDACPTKCLQVPVSSASRCMFVRSQTKYLNWFCLQHWQKHERRPNYYTDILGTFRHSEMRRCYMPSQWGRGCVGSGKSPCGCTTPPCSSAQIKCEHLTAQGDYWLVCFQTHPAFLRNIRFGWILFSEVVNTFHQFLPPCIRFYLAVVSFMSGKKTENDDGNYWSTKLISFCWFDLCNMGCWAATAGLKTWVYGDIWRWCQWRWSKSPMRWMQSVLKRDFNFCRKSTS